MATRIFVKDEPRSTLENIFPNLIKRDQFGPKTLHIPPRNPIILPKHPLPPQNIPRPPQRPTNPPQGHFMRSLALTSMYPPANSFLDLHPNANELWPNQCKQEPLPLNFSENENFNAEEEPTDNPELKCGKYVCFECNKSFQRKDKLTRHVNCVHEKLKPFPCNLCDQFFSRKDKLKRHFSTIHMKERPFICNHCSFQCNRRDRIKQHVTAVHSTHPDDYVYQPGNTLLNLSNLTSLQSDNNGVTNADHQNNQQSVVN